MHEFAAGIPAYDVFFKGFFAAFGHLETTFPDWVYGVLAGLALLVTSACSGHGLPRPKPTECRSA